MFGLWVCRESPVLTTLRKVLLDARARSGRPIKILRTDGDGIFRSDTFNKIKEEFNFIHERPAPYDHNKSAVVDRECRTLLEGTATLLFQSGAPPSWWQEAGSYFVFVRNRLRLDTESVGVFVSSEEKLRGIIKPFVLKNFVPFGAQVNCLIPPEARKDKKTPGQRKSFEGAVVGIAEDCSAYKVWDFEAQKVRDVSFSFSVSKTKKG